MSATRRISLPQMNGNLAGGYKAQIPILPQNEIYREIIMVLTGITKAQLSEITLTAGSVQIVPALSGTELQAINTKNGETADASILSIKFYQENAATEYEKRMGELDTVARNGQDKKFEEFSLLIKPDAAHAGASIECYAIVSEEKKPGADMTDSDDRNDTDTSDLFRCFVKSQKPLTSVGRNEFPLFVGTSKVNHVRQVHLFHAYITNFELVKDGKTYYDREPVTLIEHTQNRQGNERKAVAGLLTLDFVEDGIELNAMPVVNSAGNPSSFKWNAITSAADTVQTIVDMYTDYKGAK